MRGGRKNSRWSERVRKERCEEKEKEVREGVEHRDSDKFIERMIEGAIK